MFFFMNNLLAAKASENKYLIRNKQDENKFKEFDSYGAEYSKYDKLGSQLKNFFGLDPLNPENSFYPDLLIIQDSHSIL